jgi:glycolate oxidase
MQFSGFDLPRLAQGALIIECDAHYLDGGKKQIEAISDTLKSHSFIKVLHADTKSARHKLWHMRSILSQACTRFLGYKVSEDIAVPLGALANFRKRVLAFSRAPHILCGLFGHAGDGNLHVQILFDDPKYKDEVTHIRHEILLLVLELGGTLAAEHGIGLQKKTYLPLEQSCALIDLQKRIKKAFDPHNLINPGKIFDV